MAALLIRAPVRWWLWLPIAVIWILVMTATSLLIQTKLPEPVAYAAVAAAGALALCLSYLLVGNRTAPREGGSRQRVWDGVTRRTLWIGAVLVVAIYLLDLAYSLANHLPPEPFMLRIRATEGLLNWVLLCLSSLVLAPLAEELLYSALLPRRVSH